MYGNRVNIVSIAAESRDARRNIARSRHPSDVIKCRVMIDEPLLVRHLKVFRLPSSYPLYHAVSLSKLNSLAKKLHQNAKCKRRETSVNRLSSNVQTDQTLSAERRLICLRAPVRTVSRPISQPAILVRMNVAKPSFTVATRCVQNAYWNIVEWSNYNPKIWWDTGAQKERERKRERERKGNKKYPVA